MLAAHAGRSLYQHAARNQNVRAAAVLLVLVNVFFFPFLWGGKNLLSSSSDISSVYPDGAAGVSQSAPSPAHWRVLDPYGSGAVAEPNFALEQHEYLRFHQPPLWNPYQAYGAPQAAAMQQQPLYPLAVPMALAPSPRMYAWYVALRFYVAGLFGFLFLRRFVEFVPALAGGIAFMLTGYFVFFCNQTHLSVEVLIPAALYGGECLLASRSWRPVVGVAAVTFCIFAGGMPESAALALLFAFAYVVFRLASQAELRRRAVPLAARYAGANLLGCALAGVLLVPFLELVLHSANAHSPAAIGGAFRGLTDVDRFPGLQLPLYVAPLMYGPPLQPVPGVGSGHLERDGYWGIIAVLLGAIGLVAAARRRMDPATVPLTWFFAATAALLVLKRFGSPLVQWIGALPVLRLIAFNKYEEPLIGFCVAALCGLGLAHVLSRRASPTDVYAGIMIGFAVLTAAYAGPSAAGLAAGPAAEFFNASILAALTAFAVAAGACHAIVARPPDAAAQASWRRFLPAGMVAALFVELSAVYYVPTFFVLNAEPAAAQNPYAGAPYIGFLQANLTRNERVIGQQAILQPDWAEAFGLQDVRDNDALFYAKYFPFVHTFLPPDTAGAMAVVVSGGYTLSSPLALRMLQLSSVKYVLEPNLQTDPGLAHANGLRLVYQRDAAIYEFARPLPRAALYSHLELLPESAVLARLADPHVDPATTAFVSAASVPEPERAAAAALAGTAPAPVTAATIAAYSPMRVDIDAGADRAALLVLNDSDYPGWTVFVDERRAALVTANYLFRGVFLPAGAHRVSFRYDAASYRLGAGITLVALLITCGIAGAGWRRDRRRGAPAASSLPEEQRWS